MKTLITFLLSFSIVSLTFLNEPSNFVPLLFLACFINLALIGIKTRVKTPVNQA